MRNYKPLIVYMAAVMFLTVAYFASPISREAVWQVFPGLETMAHAHPLGTALLFLVTSYRPCISGLSLHANDLHSGGLLHGWV